MNIETKLDKLKRCAELASLSANLRLDSALAAAVVLITPTDENRREYELKMAEVNLVLTEWRELLDEMEQSK